MKTTGKCVPEGCNVKSKADLIMTSASSARLQTTTLKCISFDAIESEVINTNANQSKRNMIANWK
jgi:hypothetical protein